MGEGDGQYYNSIEEDYMGNSSLLSDTGHMDEATGKTIWLEDAKTFVKRIYAATAQYAPMGFEPPTVRRMEETDCRKIQAELDTSVRPAGAFFHKNKDIALDEPMGPDQKLSAFEYGTLAHEFGHYVGRRMYFDFVSPFVREHNPDDSLARELLGYKFYLRSDFFAERFKDAVGQELDVPLPYDEENLKDRQQREDLDYQHLYDSFKPYIRGPIDDSLEDLFANVEQEVAHLVEDETLSDLLVLALHRQ